MKLRVLAFALAILAFFLFVGSPFQQAANAVLVDTAVIAIIIAALSAMGITFSVTAAYGSLEQYVSGLLEEYSTSIGTTTSGLLRGCQSGSNRLGQLLLNNRFIVVIEAFATWLVAKFNLNDNDRVTVRENTTTIGSLVAYQMPFTLTRVQGTKYTYEIYRGSGVFVIMSKDYDSSGTLFAYPHFFSSNNSQIQRIQIAPDGRLFPENPAELVYSERYGYYYLQYGFFGIDNYPMIGDMYLYTMQEIEQSISGEYVPGQPEIDVITGVITTPSDDPDYTEGDGAVIDFEAPWGIAYDDITDNLIPGIFSDDEIDNVAIDYVAEENVTDQVSDTATADISSQATDYQVIGLSSVFPFCIPFDLYNFVSCLAADPVAPSFTWRFYVPGICDESIEIDLSEFDAAAQILRTMELLLFCVGLAFVTRKIIRG